MPGATMHADEIDIDVPLVRRLIGTQFPRWAHLPITPVPGTGTDNAMYRLGHDLAVRLPRVARAAHQVDKDHRWLPRLAPLLPLPVPVPVGRGLPGEGYPVPWSVYRWLDGHDAAARPVKDLHRVAVDLGRFVAALRGIDTAGGPAAFRGGPLSARDADVRAAVRDLPAAEAGAAATAAWESALAAPAWPGPPVWVHSDLLPGNLLVRAGRLAAVLDFGGAGVGDPAGDLLPAWTMLTAGTRPVFRAAAGTAGGDDATWARGRGWALCFGLTAWQYYRDSNPVLARTGRRAVAEVLASPPGD